MVPLRPNVSVTFLLSLVLTASTSCTPRHCVWAPVFLINCFTLRPFRLSSFTPCNIFVFLSQHAHWGRHVRANVNQVPEPIQSVIFPERHHLLCSTADQACFYSLTLSGRNPDILGHGRSL
ncbi:hypothetical protein EDC04DRAFT_2017916 [Pisolithus marmoratus]|nr:hypothetical protein EDC04DRAFT_2017916 [Pisolithus marmoratus]